MGVPLGFQFRVMMAILAGITAQKEEKDHRYGNVYCNMPCDQMDHLLCKFTRHQTVETCSKIHGRLSPEGRMLILKYHNDLRNALSISTAKNEFRDEDDPSECLSYFWNQGFGSSRCSRQLSWSYENERAAQIYAGQCTNYLYPCITEYKEGFPQYMNIHTAVGQKEEKNILQEAFEHWRASNLTIPVSRFPGMSIAEMLKVSQTVLPISPELEPWANLVYFRTFMLGCGIAYFHENATDKATVVCVYGPGINYIPQLIANNVKYGGALYLMPDELHQDCSSAVVSKDGPKWDLKSACPIDLCECRLMKYDRPGPLVDPNFVLHYPCRNNNLAYKTTDYPFLCASRFQGADRRPALIPHFARYLRGCSTVFCLHSVAVELIFLVVLTALT